MLKYFFVLMLLITATGATAQSWMTGYEFRKKITFDKSKVAATRTSVQAGIRYDDVTDFTVLLEFADIVFKYRGASCDGINSDLLGRNVAFSTLEAPSVKLSFQIESYDPVNGKYRCWIRIPSLSAAETPTAATSIYFYYSGSALHDSESPDGLKTWPDTYQRVWHMNPGTTGMSTGNFVDAKLGNGLALNGSTEFIKAAPDTSTRVCISVWIKLNHIGTEQVIIANDTTTGGYIVKVKADGNLAFETRNNGVSSTLNINAAITANAWHHITVAFDEGNKTYFLNGVYKGGGGSAALRIGRGGSLSIGRSKQGDKYFDGVIDELWIERGGRSTTWVKNMFTNQNDPASFYAIGVEELSPSWATFTGAVSTAWATTGNWSNNMKPVAGGKVRVTAGKTARITGADVVFGQLTVDAGATLSSGVNLQLNCNAKIGSGAVVNMDAGKKLTLAGDGLTISGEGSIHTDNLEVNSLKAGSEVLLQTVVEVSKQLKMIKGRLNADGKLMLLSTSQINTAALLPIANLDEASIVGAVNVQKYVSGGFPAPSTARGWRLLSSPVFTSGLEGSRYYGLKDIQKNIFVTGANEAVNGFDSSPNHGATIYTHDEQRAGTILQKYIAIPNMAATVPMGKGIYVYSRGGRSAGNAYQQQIQTAPFVNPGGYILTYTGWLLTGNLIVDCSNKNSGGAGDGFNLIGNPYAAAVTWGGLAKVNLQDVVWLYDPLNGSYYTSNDPATVISAGSGFFVRVKQGFSSGSVGFTEASKYTGVVPALPVLALASSDSELLKTRSHSSAIPLTTATLNIVLRKGEFKQPFLLIYTSSGKPGYAEGDALKVGEGLVSIGSLSADSVRLSIDERGPSAHLQNIRLFVKGFETGQYELHFKGAESFAGNLVLSLQDNYLKTKKNLEVKDSVLYFDIDLNKPESYGDNRFVLVLNEKSYEPAAKAEDALVVVFPNPFTRLLYLRVNRSVANFRVVVTDLMGSRVLEKSFQQLTKDAEVGVDGSSLFKGIYILRVFDGTKQIGKGIKIIKE